MIEHMFSLATHELDGHADPGALTDELLAAQLAACARLRAALDGREASLLAEFDRRKIADQAGYAHSADWLSRRTHISASAARARVAAAEVLASLPAVASALACGTLTTDHVRSLVRAGQDLGIEAVAARDAHFAEVAARLEPEPFARRIRRWVLEQRPTPESKREDDEGVGPDHSAAQETFEARRASSGIDPATGIGFVNADLPADDHAIVHNALWAIADELWRAQHGEHASLPDRLAPTARQRLADALVEMARRAMAVGAAGRGNVRPLVHVLIDYDAHTGRLASDGIATLADGTPIDASTARRLACEAGILPTILNGASQPLDIGREQRLATPAQRRAMLARARTCEWPGCTTPASWCQAHHLHFWEDGGPTDIANLAWMCNAHHHLAHEGGWSVTRASSGEVRATPPRRPAIPPESAPATSAGSTTAADSTPATATSSTGTSPRPVPPRSRPTPPGSAPPNRRARAAGAPATDRPLRPHDHQAMVA
jgi:hypothetical protein